MGEIQASQINWEKIERDLVLKLGLLRVSVGACEGPEQAMYVRDVVTPLLVQLALFSEAIVVPEGEADAGTVQSVADATRSTAQWLSEAVRMVRCLAGFIIVQAGGTAMLIRDINAQRAVNTASDFEARLLAAGIRVII